MDSWSQLHIASVMSAASAAAAELGREYAKSIYASRQADFKKVISLYMSDASAASLQDNIQKLVNSRFDTVEVGSMLKSVAPAFYNEEHGSGLIEAFNKGFREQLESIVEYALED